MRNYPKIIPIYTGIDSEITKDQKENLALDLYTLPLVSQYKLFVFQGTADGTLLRANFNQNDIIGKTIIVKGIKAVAYYLNASEDLEFTDGVNTNTETIPANERVNRLFDNINSNCILNLLLNGSPLNCFPFQGAGIRTNFDLELELDNIFYKFPARLTSLECRLTASAMTTFSPLTTNNVQVRVFLQCYLI